MGSLKNAIFTFTKAQSSAGTATAIDFGITILLAKICGFDDTWSTFIGAVSGGITNCIINYRWVFHAEGQKKRYVALKYFLVWSVSIATNTLGTRYLSRLMNLDVVIAKAIVAACVAVLWNYQMQRTFVFKKTKEEEPKDK
ncbi:MAG: GtrA family protein [Prevotella sp.]|nr:GtrA family protein [Prevotella sp.]